MARKSSNEVFNKCNISGIEPFLIQAKLLSGVGTLFAKNDDRLPKAVFYGQLKERNKN